MTVLLIVNPAAGGGRAGRALPGVRAELGRLGVEHEVELTRDLPHARELAQAAAARQQAAVAFGGDGLAGAVAAALHEAGGVLGVLPGGRGNDFARVLGIPLEPRAACHVLADGVSCEIDLARAGGRTFVGIASCGFDSHANRIANETRIVRGNLVYAYGALRALATWRPAQFTVTVDDDPPLHSTGYTVAAANSGAYGGGMLMAPSASLRDGQLDVVVVSHVPKHRFLRLLPTVFSGAHVRQPNVSVTRARRVLIEADRPFTVYADGDPVGELPLVVEALPAAVRVLVPREYPVP